MITIDTATTSPLWPNRLAAPGRSGGGGDLRVRAHLPQKGDKGTDHGHGSVYWVLGGGIKGGQIAGEQIAASRASLFQNRDYPVLTDYRALFGGLPQRMYELDAAQLATAFPAGAVKDLGLV